MKIAHLFQGSGISFSESRAAQLHIYHTIHGSQQSGYDVALLALQGRQVLFTRDLQVFKTDELVDTHFGVLGLSGSNPFKLCESGIRHVQTRLKLPYLALFDNYRMYDACCQNLSGYDLIHERYNLLSMGGALASRKLGIPFILEINADLIEQRKFKGSPEKGIRRLFAKWSTRFCFNIAKSIICISSDLKDHLQTQWKVEASKLVVLPCAADVEIFGKKYNTKFLKHNLGLTNEPVVMWVGGFYKWHDLDLLLKSFVTVLQALPNTRLVLVGDGETRPIIEQKINQFGFQHAVIMTGNIPYKKIPEMLAIADVTVVPSTPVSANRGGTGTPLKLFEYMAAGKAIVATSLHHASVVIRDGVTGLLVEPGNVDAFANAIVYLLNNPEERKCLGKNARRAALEQYSWKHYARRLKEIYLSAL
jgi:glycosyltransferase involved in cell wall biosynthesis